MSEPLRRGPVGGAADEDGSRHRCGVAALIAAAGLAGYAVSWLPQTETPLGLTVEADASIDDIVVRFATSKAFLQAKLSCDFGKALQDTVKQWAEAQQAGELDGSAVAVLVVAEPVGTVRELAKALDRRRDGTALSADQTVQLGRLRQLLESHLPDADAVDAVLDRAYIREVDGHQDSARAAEGAARLDGTIVSAGHGDAALRALRDGVQQCAARRGPETGVEDWRRWLREAQVPAHSDPEGVLAARLQAAEDAVAEYRSELAADVDVLPLTGFGVPSLHLPGLARDLRVHRITDGTTQDDFAYGGRPLGVVRREGRVLLIGQPGAGKTVALRQIAAHYAAIPHAPLPVVVPLKEVATIVSRERHAPLTMREMVDLATPGADEIRRTALLNRIAGGHAILLFDALDETLEARDRVVAALARLLSSQHSDLDVVVTSRHSAADAATALDLAAYELEEPLRLQGSLHELLRHVMPTDVGDPDAWLQERYDYIERSQHDEPAIWSVPLLAVLAVLLLTGRQPQQMPSTRATLLHQVIEDSVRRWARHREDATLPGLDAAISAHVLVDVFADIASVVADHGRSTDAVEVVQSRLSSEHWGLPPGPARLAARAAVEYWDATAGIFITAERHGELAARTRLFTEIGDAMRHTRAGEQAAAWVATAAPDQERHETLRLAAGLSPIAAEALANLAIDRRDELLDVACAAWADGSRLSPDSVRGILAAQIDRLRTLPMEVPPLRSGSPGIKELLTTHTSPFAQLAVRLAQLPLRQDQIDLLIDTCADLPQRQRDVISALAAAHRADLDPEEPDSATLGAIEAALQPDVQVSDIGDRASRAHGDVPWGSGPLVEVALRLLLHRRPASTYRVALTGYGCSMGVYRKVEQALKALGHDDILAAIARPIFSPTMLAGVRALEENRHSPYAAAIEAFGAGTDLTPSQAWHLDEVSALIDALGLVEQEIGVSADAGTRYRDETKDLVRAVADAAGLPTQVIGSQLEQIWSESPEGPDWSLTYGASRRLQVDRLEPSDEHLDVGVRAWRTANRWLTGVALGLFLGAGRFPDGVLAGVLAEIEGWPAWGRYHASLAIASIRPEAELPLDDPMVRAGHAAWKAHEASDPEVIARLLADPDLTVRDLAAARVSSPDPETLSRFQKALESPATQWTCRRCDTVRAADLGSCPDTKCARPTPQLKT